MAPDPSPQKKNPSPKRGPKDSPREGAALNPKKKTKLTKEQLKNLSPEALKKLKLAIAKKRLLKEQAEPAKAAPPDKTMPAKTAAADGAPAIEALPPQRQRASDRPSFLQTASRPSGSHSVSDHTIGKMSYDQAMRLIGKRKVFNLLGLCFFVIVGLSCIIWLANEYSQKAEILHAVSEGMRALENDEFEAAESKFRLAYQLYVANYSGFGKQLWFNDGGIEMSMIRAADGWRSLGQYKPAIDIYAAVNLNSPYGPDSFIGQAMHQSQLEFAQSSQWTEEDIQAMYKLLAQTDPYSWGKGAISQIRLTEWIGFLAHPVEERFRDAKQVVFGTPMVSEKPEKHKFLFDAQFFYKLAQRPRPVDVYIPERMNEAERRRIEWYVERNFACLLFCGQVGDDLVLQGIEGIALSENPLVGMFDALVMGGDEL